MHCALKGQIDFLEGRHHANAAEWYEANAAFSAAVNLFDEAMGLAFVSEYPDDYLRAKRGQARFRTYTSQYELTGLGDTALLDAAIGDLTDVPLSVLSTLGGTSLPAALNLRGGRLKREGRLIAALDDLTRAEDLCQRYRTTPEVRTIIDYARGAAADCRVWIAMQGGRAGEVRATCEAAMALCPAASLPLAGLAHGTKYLLNELETPETAQFAVKVADAIEGAAAALGHSGEPLRFALSHAGGLLRIAAERLEREDLAGRAYALLQQAIAIDDSTGAPEMYGVAAQTAIWIARACLRRNQRRDAVGFMEDACDYLRESLVIAGIRGASDAFIPAVTHSVLGSTLVRLHGLTWRPEDLDQAIEHLLQARALGNETPELMGILGDAFFRRGRARGDVDDLQQALGLKDAARLAGSASPENWSVSAAASALLWNRTHDLWHFSRAMRFASEAAAVDPDWPWPIFQLAELAAEPAEQRQVAAQYLGREIRTRPHLSETLNGNQVGLYRKACEVALARDYRHQELGGRTVVYALEDVHRLLSRALVFKPTALSNAERERDTVEEFSHFLQQMEVPAHFLLPEPVVIVPREGDQQVIYVMRRAHGRCLGDLVVDWAGERGEWPLNAYRRALEFLAYYHIWGDRRGGGAQGGRALRDHCKKIGARWAKLGAADGGRLTNELVEAVPTVQSGLLKKDAHPENWLVGAHGEIVMIDLEAGAFLPPLFEVAQLLEDYPLLEMTDAGWAMRAELCLDYLALLRAHGVSVESESESVVNAYSAFALLRAAFGIARIHGGKVDPKSPPSSSSLRALGLRERHLVGLVQYLTERGGTAPVRHAAGYLLSLYARIADVL